MIATGSASMDLAPSTGALHWYVVCCKPRQETIAQQNLQQQGFEVYLPRTLVRTRRRDRWVDVVQVLFPRYLFLRADRRQQSTAPVRSTRGAVGLVRFGAEPAVVPDRLIAAIIARADAATGLHDNGQKSWVPGQAVTMVDGPFAGMDAIFSKADGDERAVLLIELLGKTNKVCVNRDWIARAA